MTAEQYGTATQIIIFSAFAAWMNYELRKEQGIFHRWPKVIRRRDWIILLAWIQPLRETFEYFLRTR